MLLVRITLFFGRRVGRLLLYPICSYGYLDLRPRLAGVINAIEADLHHINDSATVLAGSRSPPDR